MKKLSILTLVLAALLSANSFAGGHSGYKTCSWWDAFCKSKHRYNTKYPIVLVHGVSGFDSLLGLVDYFHDIPDELREGRAKVYTPNITAWHDAYVRGEQLHDYIVNYVLPHSGASKVNLIGHSLGGPTSRYVAAINPGVVASVTTVNGTNFGSGFADWGMRVFPEGTWRNGVLADLLGLLGDVTDALSGNPEYEQDALESVKFMTTAQMNSFNRQFPNGKPSKNCGEGSSKVNGIRYYSWGSTGQSTNILDVSDALLIVTGGLGFSNNNHDGLVARCSQHWGDVIKSNYRLNHLDATNLLFGMTGWTDPRDIYENHAERLRGLGL
ncbi:MAG: triacylglycerol lipase [Pseudomonadales bacterium]|nr:triacylglycerol lipase [Pseudomonadales bacterium]